MGAGSWRCHGFSPWNQGSGLWRPDGFDDRGREGLEIVGKFMNAEARNPFSFKPLPPHVAVQGNDLGVIGGNGAVQVLSATWGSRRSQSQHDEGDVDGEPNQYGGNGKMQHGLTSRLRSRQTPKLFPSPRVEQAA